MNTSRLIFEIEIARQRLNHAMVTRNHALQVETQKQLANLNSMFFESVTKEIKMERSSISYLVFCEAHPDGVVVSQVEYRALCKTMTKDDFATHTAIEVDGSLTDATEQQLVLIKTVEKSQKKTA